MEYIALIPSYQPDELLINVVNDCMKSFHVVVIDDGSGSEYKSIFDKVSDTCTVLTHDVNKGKGAALKTGFAYIKEAFKDKEYAIVTVDGDGQHTYDDAMKVIQEAERRPDSLILGSRNFKETDQKKSVFGNFLARSLMRLSTGTNIYDTQTGLRAFTYKNIDSMLQIDGDRYEYETNMILYLSRAGVPVIEVPIATIYLDNNSRSHYNPLKDSLRIFRQFLKFTASSLIGFIVNMALFIFLISILPKDMALLATIANIISCLASSIVNFVLNRFFVFKIKKGNTLEYSIKYFSLTILNTGIKTVGVGFLVDGLRWNAELIKILTEVIMFIISYLVQKFFIFKAKKKQQ